MGLLGTGLKYGTIFVVAREGMKAYENHNQKKHAQQQQQQRSPNQPIEEGPYMSSAQPQQPPYQDSRDISECFHQVWCNGRCGGGCGGADVVRNMQVQRSSAKQESDVKLPQY